jgi:hypothetical protein
MAKLAVLPDQDIISGFKGTLDFYVFLGIPCARSWPQPPKLPRTAKVQEQWPIFTTASTAWLATDDESRAAMLKMTSGSTMSGRDLATKLYINGKNLIRF